MNRRLVLLAALAAATPVGSQPVDVAGVKYAPTVTLAGHTLVLNGAGIRHKFVVKVYTAGLYLSSKAAAPEAVLSAPGAKRIHVVMLRDIDANELGRLFTRGMQDNSTREEFGKSIDGTLRMADIFSMHKKLVAGDSFSVDYVPGVGTLVQINGKSQGEAIREPEFFAALLRIWLGKNPASSELKRNLLGQSSSNVGGSPGQQ